MKCCAFTPAIFFFVVFGVLVGGFVLLVVKLLQNTKNSAWTGQVVDKNINQKRDRDHRNRIETFYVLVVQQDGGRKMNLGVSRELYESFEIGDKIIKEKGSLLPRKP